MRDKRPMLELEDITKIYGKGESRVIALNNINLRIYEGEFISILGPSGSGKSTLLHMIGLLDTPTKGKIIIEGKDVSKLSEDERAHIRGKTIGFVFQTFNLMPNLTALENVELPMMIYDVDEEERRKRATALLSKLGLKHRLDHLPSQLSGGQRQRVAIARALANEPKLILADEPTGNLDSKSGEEVLNIMKSLHNEGRTIVIVTHDESITEHAERIIKIKDGKIISDEYK